MFSLRSIVRSLPRSSPILLRSALSTTAVPLGGANPRNDLNISVKSTSTDPATGLAADELEVSVKPIPRPNEPIENKRARLLYQSRKRGILETDLLLSRFAAKYLKSMTMAELEEYDRLLDMPDWDIYYWATKNYSVTPLKDEWKDSEILKRLQAFSVNKEKQVLRMPELSEYK